MKRKCYWFVLLSFIPSFALFGPMTSGFTTLSAISIIIPLIVLFITQKLFVDWYLIKPTDDFLNAIHRAIRGDYRARFSCDEINDEFHKLSQSYNELMGIVEVQTEELTQNRILQNQLYENEKIYRTALELTCDRVFEADLTHNKMISGQETYFHAFPFLKTEIYEEVIKSIAQYAILDDDKKRYIDTLSRAHLFEVFNSGATTVDLEYREKSPTGEYQWMAATVVHLSHNSGNSEKIIGYVKNIDQRKKQELEILKQSQKDGLTTLYNKKATQMLIESILENDKARNASAVIMLDIDNFKKINDTLGHIQGDSALSQVGEKLQNLFRPTDIVGRIGGDEFLIFFNNYSSFNTLIGKLDMISSMFQEISLGDGSFKISGSIGVSLYPQDGTTYAELYQKADRALYYSKSRGKNCYNIYSGRYEDKAAVEVNKPIPIDMVRKASNDND